MATLTREQLYNLINTNLPDNTSQLIDPEEHREVLYNIVDSFINLINDRDRAALTFWNSTIAYIYGETVVGDGTSGIYGTIYSCNVSSTVSGIWSDIQWTEISTYIPEATAGLSIYLEKINGIETPNKQIFTLADDIQLNMLNTGFYYYHTSNSGNVGLNKDYPEYGISNLTVLKNSNVNYNTYYYVNRTTGNFYYKNGTGNWKILITSENIADYIPDSTASVALLTENPTIQDQFCLQTIDNNGQYIGSDIYYANSNTVLLELLKIQKEIVIICTDYIQMSASDPIIVGKYKKKILGQKIIFSAGSYTFTTVGSTLRSQIDFQNTVEMSGDVSFFCSNTNDNYCELILNYLKSNGYTLTNIGDSGYMLINTVNVYNTTLSGSFVENFDYYNASSKADKIEATTSGQLELLTIDSTGQYVGSSIYKIGSNDDFVTFMGIEGNATGIFTVNNLTLSTLLVTVGAGAKTIIGEGNYININDVLTFTSTSTNTITLNFEHLLKFTTATSEIVFSTTNSVVFNANKIRNTFGSNTKITKTGGGSLFLRAIYLEDNVILSTTGSVIIGEGEAFRNTNTKYSYSLITDINALNSTKKTVFCAETGRAYKYVASGSAYTVDNDYVLATADGGDTRFVSLDYDIINTSTTFVNKFNSFENTSGLFTSAIPSGFLLTDIVVDFHQFHDDFTNFTLIYDPTDLNKTIVSKTYSGTAHSYYLSHDSSFMWTDANVSTQNLYKVFNNSGSPKNIQINFTAPVTQDFTIVFRCEKVNF